MINKLHSRVKEKLSEKRFAHTLGVVKMAEYLGKKCLPNMIEELMYAAYLHDITKEVSDDTQNELLSRCGFELTENEWLSKPIHHSYTAPIVIKRDFPEYATENVLSAVLKHTVLDPEMSLFDEIIFIADFIEDGRKYDVCREARRDLLSSLEGETDVEKKLCILHLSVLRVIDFTIKYLENKGKAVNSRMLLARKSIARKLI